MTGVTSDIQWLLSKRSPGVSHTVNRVDSHSGMSALHAASAQGHLEIIKVKFSVAVITGVSHTVNRVDSHSGMSALHAASAQGHLEIIKVTDYGVYIPVISYFILTIFRYKLYHAILLV